MTRVILLKIKIPISPGINKIGLGPEPIFSKKTGYPLTFKELISVFIETTYFIKSWTKTEQKTLKEKTESLLNDELNRKEVMYL